MNRKIKFNVEEVSCKERIKSVVEVLPKDNEQLKESLLMGSCQLLALSLYHVFPGVQLVYINDDKQNLEHSMYHTLIKYCGVYIDASGIVARTTAELSEYIEKNYSLGDENYSIYIGHDAELKLLHFIEKQSFINKGSFKNELLDKLYEYMEDSDDGFYDKEIMTYRYLTELI